MVRRTPIPFTSSLQHQQQQQQHNNSSNIGESSSNRPISSSSSLCSSSSSSSSSAATVNLVNVNILNGKSPKTIIVTTTPSSSSNSSSKASSIEMPSTSLDQISLSSASSNSSKTINVVEEAPPIPPRSNKTMPITNDINRPLKLQQTTSAVSTTPSISKNNSLEMPTTTTTMTENSQNHSHETSSNNIKINPNISSSLSLSASGSTTTPLLSQKQKQQQQQQQQKEQEDSDDDSNPICGPAETISGIIDTRPIEQRTNYVSFASLTNNLTTNFNLITINDTTTGSSKEAGMKEDNNKVSNTYLLKSNQMNNNTNFSNMNGSNNHQRHMSMPVTGTPIKTLPSSPSTFQASISQKLPNNMSPLKSASSCANNPSKIYNQKLYENIKMKSAGNLISLNNLNNNSNSSSSSNVSYENINLEYINRLMKEGYSKENVMAALCISRNNFEMACDILHEFVSTDGSQTQNCSKAFESNR